MLEFLDIHNVHSYCEKEGRDFFEALAETTNYSYFDLRSVQQLIYFKYPLVKYHTIQKLFIPYIIFLLFFVTYMNVFTDIKKVTIEDDPIFFILNITV